MGLARGLASSLMRRFHPAHCSIGLLFLFYDHFINRDARLASLNLDPIAIVRDKSNALERVELNCAVRLPLNEITDRCPTK